MLSVMLLQRKSADIRAAPGLRQPPMQLKKELSLCSALLNARNPGDPTLHRCAEMLWLRMPSLKAIWAENALCRGIFL